MVKTKHYHKNVTVPVSQKLYDLIDAHIKKLNSNAVVTTNWADWVRQAIIDKVKKDFSPEELKGLSLPKD